MSLTRAVARPMLASMFVVGGLDAVRHPEGKVKAAEPVARPIAQRVPGLPEDTETLVRVNGAVMVGAGTLLALGKLRRLAALALIGTIVPTTYAGHRFWEETEEATRAQQRIHFLKNLGLLGGLILAAVDTGGRPSLGWRAKRGARRAARAVSGGRGRAAGRGRPGAHDAIVGVEDLLAMVPVSTGRGAKKAAGAAQAGGARAVQEAARAAARARAAGSSPNAKAARKAAKAAAAKAFKETSRAAKEAGRSGREARMAAAAAARTAAVRAARAAQKAGVEAEPDAVWAALVNAQKAAPQAVSRAARRGRAVAEPALAGGLHRAGEVLSHVAERRPGA